MKQETRRAMLESHYQIKIPPKKYSVLLLLDNVNDRSVVEFVKEYCKLWFDVLYEGQANTIVGKRKRHK